MAEKLSIKIELDGAAEIARQLEGIGDAGQKAFGDIAKAADKAGGFKQLAPEEVTAKLQEMGVTGADAIKKIQDAVKAAGRLETLVGGISGAQSAFAALKIAAVPVIAGLVVGAGAVLTAWQSVAKSINEVSASAAKLGLSFKQFDKLRQGFEQAGIASGTITSGMQHLKSELDKLNVERVKTAFQELQIAADRGFGAQGTAQLRILEETAKGAGQAAEVARQSLEKLGLPVPEGAAEGLKALGIEGGKLSEVVPQVVAKLQAMPDSVQRTDIAIAALGEKLGIELIAALRTGSLAIDQFKAATGSLTNEQQIAAAETEQSINKMDTAWRDFKASVIAPIAIPLLDFMKEGLDEINKRIATTKREWELLQQILSAITPKTTIDISLTRSLAPEIEKTNQALAQTGAAGAQAGQQLSQGMDQATQAAAQAGRAFQIVRNPFTGMPEVINATNQALAQTGAAAQQAGQAFQIVRNPFTGMPEAINATNQALAQTGQAAQQAGQATAQAAQQGASAWQTLPAAVNQAIATVTEFVSTMGTIAWDTISGLGVSAWNVLTGAIQSAIDKLLQFIGLKPSAPSTGGGAPGKARGGLMGGRGTGTSDSNLAWLSRGEYIMPARAVAKPGVLAFLEALRRSGRIPGFAAGGMVSGGGTKTITLSVDNILQAIQTQTEAIASQSDVIIGLGQIIGELVQVVSSLVQSQTKNARGGLLGGRGTGTSDSNLAWVSRGEHIMPARAVRQPGVLAFLEALRRSGGNLAHVLDGMGRFALGGMVPRAIPAFAGGGLAGGGNHVTIQFPGLPAISGLRASSDVVDQLHKAAALAQVRSGGRKPSRYS